MEEIFVKNFIARAKNKVIIFNFYAFPGAKIFWLALSSELLGYDMLLTIREKIFYLCGGESE